MSEWEHPDGRRVIDTPDTDEQAAKSTDWQDLLDFAEAMEIRARIEEARLANHKELLAIAMETLERIKNMRNLDDGRYAAEEAEYAIAHILLQSEYGRR